MDFVYIRELVDTVCIDGADVRYVQYLSKRHLHSFKFTLVDKAVHRTEPCDVSSSCDITVVLFQEQDTTVSKETQPLFILF